MPGSDASQFTRFKRANAVQGRDTDTSNGKSVTRLTLYTPQLSASYSRTEFLSTLTSKSTTPITRDPTNFQSAFGKLGNPHQNCS